MKKKSIFILCLLIIGTVVVLNSCKKDNNGPTSLQIILTDGYGDAISGATVMLYTNLTDWQDSTNQVGATQISDANGKVTFTNLQPTIIYYWYAQYGCMNNVNGTINLPYTLAANTTTTLITALYSTGTVEFINNSTNPYYCYINGQDAFSLNGGQTADVPYLLVGTYVFSVLQISGYTTTPINETFSVNITCGATSVLTFP